MRQSQVAILYGNLQQDGVKQNQDDLQYHQSFTWFPDNGLCSCRQLVQFGNCHKATRSRNIEYIGALRANRVLYYPGGPKIVNRVKTHTGNLTKDDVHLVTVGKNKYWVHCFKGYIKKLPRNAKILISWPFDKLFDETEYIYLSALKKTRIHIFWRPILAGGGLKYSSETARCSLTWITTRSVVKTE